MGIFMHHFCNSNHVGCRRYTQTKSGAFGKGCTRFYRSISPCHYKSTGFVANSSPDKARSALDSGQFNSRCTCKFYCMVDFRRDCGLRYWTQHHVVSGYCILAGCNTNHSNGTDWIQHSSHGLVVTFDQEDWIAYSTTRCRSLVDGWYFEWTSCNYDQWLVVSRGHHHNVAEYFRRQFVLLDRNHISTRWGRNL
ncbi:MAG: Uncharacterised protein [Marine Group II euryarchaeote MED-G33]|nr:MAG: Uncharacterised protein [Marine Group II euryarchaeote MED-G33]